MGNGVEITYLFGERPLLVGIRQLVPRHGEMVVIESLGYEVDVVAWIEAANAEQAVLVSLKMPGVR